SPSATLSVATSPAGSAIACCGTLALAIDSQPASSATAVADSVAVPRPPTNRRRLVSAAGGMMRLVDIGLLLIGSGSAQQAALPQRGRSYPPVALPIRCRPMFGCIAAAEVVRFSAIKFALSPP